MTLQRLSPFWTAVTDEDAVGGRGGVREDSEEDGLSDLDSAGENFRCRTGWCVDGDVLGVSVATVGTVAVPFSTIPR